MTSRRDWFWVSFLITAACCFVALSGPDFFSSSVLLSGTACVALIAIGRREGYLLGLYNSGAYAVLAYQNGLFGEVWLNLGFYLPTGILGWLMWSRRLAPDHVVVMRGLSTRGWVFVSGICVIGTLVVGFALGLIASQNTPYIDAATNVLSVTATILMLLRFREQWALYFALNILTIVMWILRWREQGEAGDAMIVMWSLFLLNSIYGWRRWTLGSRASETATYD